jgi:hypothetical protein
MAGSDWYSNWRLVPASFLIPIIHFVKRLQGFFTRYLRNPSPAPVIMFEEVWFVSGTPFE